jgi:hypothetical protein
MGALHPVLFFAGVYTVALIFSIFICSSIFYSCNATKAEISKKTEKTQPVAATGYVSNMATIH